jgi:hypothetical protein
VLNLTEVAPAPLSRVRPVLARSITAALLLCGDLIVALLLSVAYWQRLTLLRQVRMGVVVEHSALVASDGLVILWSRISILVAVGTAVAFLTWLYRANQNLRAFRGEPLEFTPGQAIGSFFIPFINLVRPYEVLREVWRATDPSLPPSSSTSFRGSEVNWIVPAWWLLFLGRNLVVWWSVFARQMGGSPLEILISTTYGMLAMYLLTIPSACAAIALVVLIERREDALTQAVESARTAEGEATLSDPRRGLTKDWS